MCSDRRSQEIAEQRKNLAVLGKSGRARRIRQRFAVGIEKHSRRGRGNRTRMPAEPCRQLGLAETGFQLTHFLENDDQLPVQKAGDFAGHTSGRHLAEIGVNEIPAER